VHFETGEVTNLRNQKTGKGEPFFEVQLEIMQHGGLS
jgi:hypothetical protein